MTFDEYCQTLYTEDFSMILDLEGKIFGRTRKNLTLDDLIKSIKKIKNKFLLAEGACLCLSSNIPYDKENIVMKIFQDLTQESEYIETYFMKKNPNLTINNDNLYSYTILLTGIKYKRVFKIPYQFIKSIIF